MVKSGNGHARNRQGCDFDPFNANGLAAKSQIATLKTGKRALGEGHTLVVLVVAPGCRVSIGAVYNLRVYTTNLHNQHTQKIIDLWGLDLAICDLLSCRRFLDKSGAWAPRCATIGVELMHGTSLLYRSGCRCADCERAYRATKPVPRRTVGAPQHGTLTMYTAHGCRCVACKDAGTDYQRGLKARRAAEHQATIDAIRAGRAV